ncbi:hypothetical protein [Parvularcula marina]|uniref:hypothetical protein n=1 Tax=Parvularcula marina TaxID=2292771 RepID=UPI003517E84A
MTRKFFGASLLCLTLIACGGKDEEPPVEDTPAAEEAPGQEIDVVDPAPEGPLMIDVTRVLGTFEGEVTGLAFSRNQQDVQGSTLLAANGTAGVAIIPTEDGGAPSVYNLVDRRVVAVAATKVGENPLIAIESTQDGLSQLDIATFTADRSELVVIGSIASGLVGTAAEFCFAGEALFRVNTDNGLSRHTVTTAEGVVGVTSEPVSAMAAVTHCASAGGTLHITGPEGKQQVLTSKGTAILTEMPFVDAPAGIADMAVMPLEGGNEIFFALANGSVEIDDEIFTFTIDGAPVAVSRIAMAPGNFGGVYRKGAVAILTTDNQLGLVSWLSIANALDLSADSVEWNGEEEEVVEDFVPQIELPAPPVEQ